MVSWKLQLDHKYKQRPLYKDILHNSGINIFKVTKYYIITEYLHGGESLFRN